MNAKDAIKATGDMSLFVLNKYVADMSDSDLLRRPGPGCNHLAWQLGHLISSELFLLRSVAPSADVELPARFNENHAKENATCDEPAKFLRRDEYLKLFEQVRAVTYQALDAMPDAKLDEPAPENFRRMFPTVGHIITLVVTHPLMHAGQFVVVRRQLGLPVVI